MRDGCGWNVSLSKSNLKHSHPAPCSLKDELLKLLDYFGLEDEAEKLAANGIKFRRDLEWVDTNDVQYLSALSQKKFYRLLQHFNGKATASDACRAGEQANLEKKENASKRLLKECTEELVNKK